MKLPDKPAARDRWLTRDEVAKLLRAARRADGQGRARHLARFILIAVYTGTRSTAILNMAFMPSTVGGHVDTKAGIMYRRSASVAESKKRTPPVPVPPSLLAHMRRWERGGRWIVEYEGQRVGSVKTAWTKALRASGIDHCTRHDLRHTAITWGLQRGMSPWDASGFFGLTMDMVQRVYGHHHPDYLHDAAALMGTKLVHSGPWPKLKAVQQGAERA